MGVQSTTSPQVAVQFSTRLPAPFALAASGAIVLDASLDRAELSQMLNELLELDPCVPFDFLVEGKQFLRGSIAELEGLNSEQTLELEYVKAVLEPEVSAAQKPINDWILALAGEHGPYTAVATAAGSVLVYSGNLCKLKVTESEFPVTCVEISGGRLFTGGKDGALRVYELATGKEAEKSTNFQVSITALSVAKTENGEEILVGLGDGRVFFGRDFRSLAEISDCRSLRISAATCVRRPGVALSGNLFVVGDVIGNLLFVKDGRVLKRHQTSKAVTCLAASSAGSFLCTGHEDGKVAAFRLLLDELDLEILATWKSHVRMVSALAFHVGPGAAADVESSRVVSVGLDGAVKLLDVRAGNFALQTATVEDKLNAALWTSSETLLVGGASGQLRTLVFPNL